VARDGPVAGYSTLGGDGAALLGLLRRLQARAERLAGGPVDIVVIQEAGLDGFWVHRLLSANGIQSHVVDPASIAVPRRRRRAKTDTIDGETLLRTLLARPARSHAAAPPSIAWVKADRHRFSALQGGPLVQRFVVGDPLAGEQTLNAVDMSDPLLQQNGAFA
jgi:hypothetical protein